MVRVCEVNASQTRFRSKKWHMTTLMTTPTTTTTTNGKIPQCPFWVQAVRDCLVNADSIIADPNLLTDEENDWMLREASQLSADALEIAEQI